MEQNSIEPNRSAQTPNVQSHAQRSTGKTELLEGRVISRPAADRAYNLITTNLILALGSRVQRSTCEIYSGDMQVKIADRSVCFPSVIVVNGEPSFADNGSSVLENPTVVIEIFSNSIPSTDRTQKLEAYLAVPSIKDCLLVNQNELRIEHYARQNVKQWIYRIYNERDDAIALESVGCKINMTEVYAQLKTGDPKLSSRAVN
jgi:Uma2 family endonuclease